MIPLPRNMVLTVHSVDALDYAAVPLQCGMGNCPWRICVASILLNRAKRPAVDRVLSKLFARWSTPMDLAKADREELTELLRPLGFQHRRAKTLIRFSAEFLEDGWSDLRDLPGVGPYVADSVGLVCFGCTELDSMDGALEAYARRLREASAA